MTRENLEAMAFRLIRQRDEITARLSQVYQAIDNYKEPVKEEPKEEETE
jgi:hypothetical protein